MCTIDDISEITYIFKKLSMLSNFDMINIHAFSNQKIQFTKYYLSNIIRDNEKINVFIKYY